MACGAIQTPVQLKSLVPELRLLGAGALLHSGAAGLKEDSGVVTVRGPAFIVIKVGSD